MESKLTAHMSTNIMCFGPITTLPLNEQKKQLPNKNKKAKITYIWLNFMEREGWNIYE